ERLEREPELCALVDDLENAAAALAQNARPRTPPPDLENKIRDAVLSHSKPVTRRGIDWIPWAIAALLLAAFTALAIDRTRMTKRIARLEHRDLLAQTQIAILSSKLESAPKAQAVVLWDAQKQEGVLKVIGAPVTAKDRDYQLWIVDPRYQQPVDAGVFGVLPDGATKITSARKRKSIQSRPSR
ncbi:MAG: anti-sigma factor, partial [Verrucomicrobiota bacterium]|nr:anti-sigma factor [Verrucomicrobiota bacterium]